MLDGFFRLCMDGSPLGVVTDALTCKFIFLHSRLHFNHYPKILLTDSFFFTRASIHLIYPYNTPFGHIHRSTKELGNLKKCLQTHRHPKSLDSTSTRMARTSTTLHLQSRLENRLWRLKKRKSMIMRVYRWEVVGLSTWRQARW